MIVWALLPPVLVASFVLTALVRRYAVKNNLVDRPGRRSSHAGVIPRGGGISIVISFLGAVSLLGFVGEIERGMVVMMLGAGGLVAGFGFLDDHGHVSVLRRLLAQFTAAAWVLFWLGGLPISVDGVSYVIPVWALYLVAILFVVWFINLYNFMDGIDGIASIEALTVCFGGALLHFVARPESDDWISPVLLFASVAGFLWWNYPPARIFLGDAGSGFLGATFAVFSLQAGWVSFNLFLAWNILLGVFIVDATVTLVRRAIRGKKLYQAHRSHAYQHAARSLGAHRSVSIAVGTINLLWLFPFAMLVATGKLHGGIGLFVSYMPLVLLAWYFQAGVEGSGNRLGRLV